MDPPQETLFGRAFEEDLEFYVKPLIYRAERHMYRPFLGHPALPGVPFGSEGLL
jgi:hypothetical protein